MSAAGPLKMPLPRRLALGLVPLLAACSVLPDRPFQEPQRFALAPARPADAPAGGRAGPALLIRSFRAAPGMDLRGLRVVGPAGQVAQEYWAEWAAPPAELAEEAVRRWLAGSGRFRAVTAPGSRLPAELVLEGELIRLEVEPAAGLARAGLAALLLAEPGGEARVLAQITAEGTAPLAAGARAAGPRPDPAAAAAAMTAALAQAIGMLEARVAAALPPARR